MHFYTRMQARQQHYFSILPFCWSIWSLCTCYFSFLYGIVKQENYILLSLIKTCTHGILWGGKTNTVATTTICYKNQTPLLNIKYNTWMRILHERYVHRLYDQSLSINKPFIVPSEYIQNSTESIGVSITMHELMKSHKSHCTQKCLIFLKTRLKCEHFDIKIEFICVPVHKIPNIH